MVVEQGDVNQITEKEIGRKADEEPKGWSEKENLKSVERNDDTQLVSPPFKGITLEKIEQEPTEKPGQHVIKMRDINRREAVLADDNEGRGARQSDIATLIKTELIDDS